MSDAEKPAEPKAPRSPPSVGLIIAIVNTLAVLGAAGFMAYTKIVFKRPPITEDLEREKIAKRKAEPKKISMPVVIDFGQQTVNISPQPQQPKPADGTTQQIQGKLHYANVGLALEIRDEAYKGLVMEAKAQLLDKFISALGRKQMQELTTVQGRYVLRAQMVDTFNETIAAIPGVPSGAKEGLVSNVFFTQFIVQ